MYKNIEDFYKKNSIYKKIKIWTFLLAFIMTPFLLAVSTSKHYVILLIVISIATILIMKRIYEKILNEKLYFNFSNKETKGNSLDSIINEKEKMILIQYIKDNNLYIKDSINCILNHYRCFIKPNVVNGNFLAILSIVVSIVVAFISKEGFDIKSFEVTLPYIISIIIVFIVIYYPISKIINIKKFITGEDGLEERLESIFSELYIEYNEKNNKNKIVKKMEERRRNQKKIRLKKLK